MHGGWVRTERATDKTHHESDCVKALRARIEALKDALRFYADDGTHAPPGHSAEGWCRDSGHRARPALGLPSEDK